MVIRTCTQIDDGLPTAVKIKMYLNLVADFGIGLVPFVGDLADAVFRANTRNAALLESHLREKGKKNLRQSGLPMPAVDPSDPDEFDRLQREDPPEYTSRQPSRHNGMSGAETGRGNGNESRNGNGGRSGSGQGAGNDRSRPMPTAPAQAKTRNDNRSSFFGIGRSRTHDVEMGTVDEGGRGNCQKPSRRGA
jgi:hypothetical protein